MPKKSANTTRQRYILGSLILIFALASVAGLFFWGSSEQMLAPQQEAKPYALPELSPAKSSQAHTILSAPALTPKTDESDRKIARVRIPPASDEVKTPSAAPPTTDIFPEMSSPAVIPQPGKTIKSGPPTKKTERIRIKMSSLPVIDYGQMDQNQKLKKMMAQRKAVFGVEKGVDLVVKSDEVFKVGDFTVAMQEILDKIRMKEGEIIEKEIEKTPNQPRPPSILDETEFGIHVVQAGENIWNLHFKLVRNYFSRHGVAVSTIADEPYTGGRSSGVGKLLKFSENLVYIYNLRERKLDVDLNLIHPLDKILIYNMRRAFKFLDQINYNKLDHLLFDGDTIWIPAEQ